MTYTRHFCTTRTVARLERALITLCLRANRFARFSALMRSRSSEVTGVYSAGVSE